MKRLLAILLAALFCLGFAACGQPAGDQTDTGTDSGSLNGTDVETTAAVTEPPVLPVSVIAGGLTEYIIIRPDKADTAVVNAATTLRSNLSAATGTEIKIQSDWHKASDVVPEKAKEIVIGICDRPGAGDILTGLREQDFAIVYGNERIYIIGGGSEATVRAAEYFYNNYVDTAAKSVTVPDNLFYTDKYDYPLGMVSVDGVKLTEYRVVIPDGCGLYTVSAAQNLTDYFYYNGGLKLDIVKDSEAPADYEILIGSTNRPESVSASSVTLAADQYILAETGSKIVIAGNSYMVGGGVSEFINNYAAPRGVNVDFDVTNLPKTCTASTFAFKEAKNAVLLIGDGMGFNHIEAALANGLPAFVARELPNRGSATTYSYSVTLGSASYTDSAAAATALATAYKTINGYIGVDRFTKSKQNVRELAASLGARTAILTTDVITGATPGGFLAHASSRNSTEEIQTQINKLLSDKAVDFAVGSIGDNLVNEARHELWAISGNGSRFFSMIEEGYIDKRSHDNNSNEMVKMVTRYNSLIAYVVEFTLCHPDTALIITADHETGGVTLNSNTNKYAFTSKNHTNSDVPVFAIGSGTEVFGTKVDNTDISKFIAKIYGAVSFGG